MANIFINSVFDFFDSVLAWFSSSLKQTTESYCDLETAENTHTLVAYDGSLISIIELNGVTYLVGGSEFTRMHEMLCVAFQSNMKRPGHAFQFFFSYNREEIKAEIKQILEPAYNTSKWIHLNLDDLFEERENYIAQFCAQEKMYLVLWPRPAMLSAEQFKRAHKAKLRFLREKEIPPLINTQNFLASIPDIRNEHDSFVRAIVNDLQVMVIDCGLMEVHD